MQISRLTSLTSELRGSLRHIFIETRRSQTYRYPGVAMGFDGIILHLFSFTFVRRSARTVCGRIQYSATVTLQSYDALTVNASNHM